MFLVLRGLEFCFGWMRKEGALTFFFVCRMR